VKTLEYRADSPGALEEFIFYDHPSVRARVQAMMDWKAAHPSSSPAGGGGAPAPEGASAQTAKSPPPT
jgi:STE24 endopeptidase